MRRRRTRRSLRRRPETFDPREAVGGVAGGARGKLGGGARPGSELMMAHAAPEPLWPNRLTCWKTGHGTGAGGARRTGTQRPARNRTEMNRMTWAT